jgi:hypothetical protein
VKIIQKNFESFEEFVAQSLVVPRDCRSSRREDSGRFHGTRNFDEAVAIARTGWPEGAAKAVEIGASVSSAVRDVINSNASSYAWDVAGQFIDIGRYLTGEPECFGTIVEDSEVIKKPVVKLVVNLSASASVSADTLVARGVAVVAAVDILEASGRRVEVVAATAHHSYSTQLEIRIPVKSAGQPLDIDRLAFCLAHPSCYRRLIWSISEQHGVLPRNCEPASVTPEGDEIATRHFYGAVNKARLLEEIKWICDQCGVEIPQQDIERLAAA